MLENGGGPNQGNQDGVTTLMLACASGSEQTVQVLAENGNFTQGTNAGWNILHFAALVDSAEVIRLCVDNSAQFQGNSQGITPFHIAAEFGCVNAMKALANHYPDNLMQRTGDDIGGLSPLDVAAKHGQNEIITLFNGKIDSDKVNEGNKDSITPLHRAAQNGHADSCAELVKLGADPMRGNTGGNTPVHLAAEKGHYQAIKKIYEEHSGKLTFCGNSNDWNTPLHLACKNGHLNAAYYLIEKNSDSLKAKNKQEHTPLDLACQFGSVPLVAMLLNKEAECTDYVFESSVNHPDVMELMLCHFQTNATQDDLKVAVSAESKKSTELLLKCGITPDEESIKTSAQKEDDSILKLLVTWGAKITQGTLNNSHEDHKQYLSGLLNQPPQTPPEEHLDYSEYEKSKLLGLYEDKLASDLM